MKPINTLLFCFLLPAGLYAVTMKDVANARCDERCKLKDYQGGYYLDTHKCRCEDDISFDQPILKLATGGGRSVITPIPPPTVIRIEY
jgi:hypothetical protein